MRPEDAMREWYKTNDYCFDCGGMGKHGDAPCRVCGGAGKPYREPATSRSVQDAKVAWLQSRCRAMSQARNDAGRQGIGEEWWTATPFRNPWIAAEIEELCNGLNAAWKRGQSGYAERVIKHDHEQKGRS
jgi:hypothetical protein